MEGCIITNGDFLLIILKFPNPYLSNENLKRIMKLTIIAILRSSRVGHTNRCISAAQKLEKKLRDILKLNESQRKEQKVRLLPNLLQAASDLAKMLATKRHYMYDMSDDDKNGSMVIFDPRFLTRLRILSNEISS